MPNLKELDTSGSSIYAFKFDAGAPIEKIIINNPATEINFQDLQQLQVLNCGTAEFNKVKIIGGALMKETGVLSAETDGKIVNAKTLMINNLANEIEEIDLRGLDWVIDNSEDEKTGERSADFGLMEKLYTLAQGVRQKVKLSGKIYFQNIDNLSLKRYEE
jgi:hypothetical protein